MATAGVVLLWLVLDAVGVGDASWEDPLAPYVRPDAADDSVHHRVLTNHLAAREPGPALRNLLVDLARGRDPELADPELRALAERPGATAHRHRHRPLPDPNRGSHVTTSDAELR